MWKHWIGLVVSTLYLLNFTLGIGPEIPDNLPLVGNLDEFAASALWLHSFQAIRNARRARMAEPENEDPLDGQG